jgi:hypothetical protein
MGYDIADLINDTLFNDAVTHRDDDAAALEQIRAKVRTLNSRFPLPS